MFPFLFLTFLFSIFYFEFLFTIFNFYLFLTFHYNQQMHNIIRVYITTSGVRIPVGARFSAPVQTGPGAHPASCTMGTASFPGLKSGRSVTLTPHPLLRPGQERVELYLYFPYGPYGLYRASVPV